MPSLTFARQFPCSRFELVACSGCLLVASSGCGHPILRIPKDQAISVISVGWEKQDMHEGFCWVDSNRDLPMLRTCVRSLPSLMTTDLAA